MEIGMIPKIFSGNTAKNPLEGINVAFKPKTRFRKMSVAKPVQQKVKIVAYSPKTLFKDRIASMFKEMTKTYGNIPLWIEYSMYPASVSWNLGNVEGTHNIRVYGEKQYAKEFLSRFGEMIRTDASDSFGDPINILSQNPSEWTGNLLKSAVNEKLLPVPLQSTPKETGFRQNLLSASSLIAGLTGVILALSFFSNKRSKNAKRRVTRNEALQAAIKSVGDLTSTNPVLESEEFAGNYWHFNISNYKVTVNNRGIVTEVKKVNRR